MCEEEHDSSIKVTMSISTDIESFTQYTVEVVVVEPISKEQVDYTSTNRMSQTSSACENIFQLIL